MSLEVAVTWVPVTERLPAAWLTRHATSVLVWDGLGVWFADLDHVRPDGQPVFTEIERQPVPMVIDVTHWADLPEGPSA